jgi:hypothetical protein
MPRKIAAAVIIFIILTSLTINASGIAEMIEVHRGNIRVVIGNRQVELEEQPFIYNDRVYVPLRFISTALDRDVEWNPVIRAVVISNPDLKLPLTECRPDEGETFVYGEITDIDYKDYTITIHQHFDDNSTPADNPLPVSRDVVIILQRDAEKNIHFYQLKSGSTGGFILDSGGRVRGIII